ncbi:hypothetical protein Pcinc_034838 [Petrolisthes cinctipes]|uniref:Uncharacterized protein n=1 Tax=Petrolisthes cinctipes TaxID=88211 RepID=A0AAE1ENI2_PETCI|nr:hypothetical protein Pcinc_034838 [Petrolisthes cinctipes]
MILVVSVAVMVGWWVSGKAIKTAVQYSISEPCNNSPPSSIDGSANVRILHIAKTPTSRHHLPSLNKSHQNDHQYQIQDGKAFTPIQSLSDLHETRPYPHVISPLINWLRAHVNQIMRDETGNSRIQNFADNFVIDGREVLRYGWEGVPPASKRQHYSKFVGSTFAFGCIFEQFRKC